MADADAGDAASNTEKSSSIQLRIWKSVPVPKPKNVMCLNPPELMLISARLS